MPQNLPLKYRLNVQLYAINTQDLDIKIAIPKLIHFINSHLPIA